MHDTTALALALAATALLAPAAAAQKTIWTFTGSTADSYGEVGDLVGDMDGDGRAEILVGAWRDDNGALSDAGSCFLYDGASGAPLPNVFGTGAGDHVGFGSSSAGDANGDGFYDVCVAGDEDDVPGVGSDAGSARVISGLTGGVLSETTGDNASDLYGWSTAAAGDVNGDGFDDVVIGALLDDAPGLGSCGSLTVVSGANGVVLFRELGSVANGRLGSHVGRAGDVNGDGLADVIGAQGTRALVFAGPAGGLLYDLANPGAGSTGKASGGIDVDLDGFDDLVLGAAGASSGAGRVRVVSGRTGLALWNVFGAAGDALGASVVGAGDLNGDGYGDFVAGATGDDTGGNNAGAVRAFSGKDGTPIGTIAGTGPGQQLGYDVGGLHDVDGDGVNDVVATSRAAARALVVSFVPQGVTPFGSGTPGCAGAQDIGTNGPALVGDAGFTVHSSNAPPGVPALLALADTPDPAGTPLAGALLHVALPPAASFFQLSGTPPADSRGSIAANVPVPPNPALAGVSLFFQVGTLWNVPGCPTLLSTSRAMRVSILP